MSPALSSGRAPGADAAQTATTHSPGANTSGISARRERCEGELAICGLLCAAIVLRGRPAVKRLLTRLRSYCPGRPLRGMMRPAGSTAVSRQAQRIVLVLVLVLGRFGPGRPTTRTRTTR